MCFVILSKSGFWGLKSCCKKSKAKTSSSKASDFSEAVPSWLLACATNYTNLSPHFIFFFYHILFIFFYNNLFTISHSLLSYFPIHTLHFSPWDPIIQLLHSTPPKHASFFTLFINLYQIFCLWAHVLSMGSRNYISIHRLLSAPRVILGYFTVTLPLYWNIDLNFIIKIKRHYLINPLTISNFIT